MKFLKEISREISKNIIGNSNNEKKMEGKIIENTNNEKEYEKEETSCAFSKISHDNVIFTSNENEGEQGLAKAEKKLEKLNKKLLGEKQNDNDEDEVKNTDSSFPNLKYARPKYKNVDSVLKYIEGQEEGKGVKLVIMNFND
jgi:hypothetical protein